MLQTYNDNGILNTYTYGIDRIQSVGENTETYLYDGRGSVVGSVSDDIVTSYAYTAYGELMPSSPEPNVFGYNGEATDFGTGMQYLRARHYDVGVGRFIQEDIYRGEPNNPKSMHRYMYVYNNPVNYVDRSGFRPVELTDVNNHTQQQTKQTTKADLLKEYQKKKLEAIAKSQDDDFRQIQQMKEDWIQDSQNGQGNGGVAPTPAEVYDEKYCNFDSINTQIYDGMDFSKYSYEELQTLYDKIDGLDIKNNAFDDVKNKRAFLRKLDKAIEGKIPNTLTAQEQSNLKSDGVWSIVAGVAAVALGVAVSIVGAPVLLTAAIVVAVVGGFSVGMGAASINESNTGSNWVKENVFFGSEKAYNTTQAVLFVGSVVGAVTLLPYAIAGVGASIAARKAAELASRVGDPEDWYKADGTINWPLNAGAVPGTEQTITLQSGDIISRYGEYGDTSYYTTQSGVDPKMLSLPPHTDPSIVTNFEIVKPIENVIQSKVAPWGGDVGGGLQYLLPKSIELLEKLEIIR